jgi:flagellar hook-basal body complex protein FliE
MNIDLSSPRIPAIAAKLADPVDSSDAGTSHPGFTNTFRHAIEDVDGQQHDASRQAAAVDSGQSDDLVGAMLSSQQASLSFSMLIQVRNKLMSAFDNVINMPV